MTELDEVKAWREMWCGANAPESREAESVARYADAAIDALERENERLKGDVDDWKLQSAAWRDSAKAAEAALELEHKRFVGEQKAKAKAEKAAEREHRRADRAEAALEERTRERDNAIQQAQVWAMEAKTQRATVLESYQAVTGATGEPGDWNGACPVKAALEELRADILDLTVNHSDVRMNGVVQYSGNVAVRDIHRMLERHGYPPKDSRWTARAAKEE